MSDTITRTREEKRAVIRGQLRELGAGRTICITCGQCGKPRGLVFMFRCFECGIWFCDHCGPSHWPEAAAGRQDYNTVRYTPEPGPRVGDVVTAENVGALPVGTVVRWEHLGEEWRAERVAANLWCAGGIEHDDEEIADEGGPVTTIASLLRVGGGGS